jgi:hypothetical protein
VIAYNTSGGPKYNPEIFAQSLPTLNNSTRPACSPSTAP